ncbi:MAG TPA: NACHT domain-containing protein [Longimicrobium sp.]|nr:NACHT domain-containing protein [Longimicrobium sp.]
MSHIAQNVTGSGNHLLAAGRDLYQVTCHVQQPSPEDRRNLLNLLGQVKQTWIADVLCHSVHETALLQLGMRTEAGAVEHPWERYLEAAGESGRVLPFEMTIGQVFDDVGRMLLILGEPGSGKTTTLLGLAREWITRAESDPAAPVPVVLNLSTWTDPRKSVHAWLVKELSVRYHVGKPLARRWLRRHNLLLLLDGLDEVADERRAQCVKALHAFVEEHGVPGMVVCCRVSEYRALPFRMKLRGAVYLLPLRQEQIDAWLRAAGPRLAGLRGALTTNAELRALAETPLMLSVMALAFDGAPIEALNLDEVPGPQRLRHQIFTVYVDRMFDRRLRADAPFTRGYTETCLRWLASGMLQRGQTIFATELLQPSLLTPQQLFSYVLISRILGAALLGITAMLPMITQISYVRGSDSAGAVYHAGPLSRWYLRISRSVPLRDSWG